MRDLHWLKVKDRIAFKVLLIIHKVIIESAPPAFEQMFKRTGSERTRKLAIPLSKGRFGDRAITVAGSKLWNSLPLHIRDELNTSQFKNKLKTFLFNDAEILYLRASMMQLHFENFSFILYSAQLSKLNGLEESCTQVSRSCG